MHRPTRSRRSRHPALSTPLLLVMALAAALAPGLIGGCAASSRQGSGAGGPGAGPASSEPGRARGANSEGVVATVHPLATEAWAAAL
ncbi:MAG: hypothetical protein AVDCRST_MAG64-3537, partial [uncultured Phycisphaerae bacterium]